MSLDLAAVRQRVAAAIASALSASGWRESTGPYDQFGVTDGEGRFDKSYAVGVPSTRPLGDRQRRSLGVLVETRVGVRWAYKLGAKRQVTDYDEALAADASIRSAIAAIGQGSDLHLILGPCSNECDDQGWATGEQEWLAYHRLPLT